MKEFKGTKGKRELVFVSGVCIGVGVKVDENYTEIISNTILPDSDEEYEEQKEEIIANASLEVAAPDMLEALQNLENDNNQIPHHAWKLVQDAIKKALGE